MDRQPENPLTAPAPALPHSSLSPNRYLPQKAPEPTSSLSSPGMCSSFVLPADWPFAVTSFYLRTLKGPNPDCPHVSSGTILASGFSVPKQNPEGTARPCSKVKRHQRCAGGLSQLGEILMPGPHPHLLNQSLCHGDPGIFFSPSWLTLLCTLAEDPWLLPSTLKIKRF